MEAVRAARLPDRSRGKRQGGPYPESAGEGTLVGETVWLTITGPHPPGFFICIDSKGTLSSFRSNTCESA